MNTLFHRFAGVVVLCCISATTLAAPQMSVSGRVDTNGDLSYESNLSDREDNEPFARPNIMVADQSAGFWEYSSRVDSTVPKLQIFGSIFNATGTQLTSIESGLLNVFASLTDTITLTPMIADPYIVTIDLVVDGDLAIDGSDARAGVSLNVAPQGKLSTNDFRSYTTTQSIVADTLSAQYQLQGETTIDITTQLFFLVRSLAPAATATGDFRNTAILNLTITALNGDPLSLEEVGISSASGNFATVPLPGSLPLASAALGGLAWRTRRRRPARR